MLTRLLALSGALATTLFAWSVVSRPEPQDRPAREDYNSGEYLYRTFCASCHGQTGKGDGPVADLSPTPPTDLTTLARRNGGTFPRSEVRAVLDGTTRVAGHTGPAMPNWHDVLLRSAHGNQDTVRRQLDALTSYIDSMQVR